jgi:DNA-binding NtrC family response regulator
VLTKPVDLRALLAFFTSDETAPVPPVAKGGRVLVIDDDPHVREPIVQYLRLAGFDPRAAEDGAAGLRLAVEQKPGVVVLDLHMPALRGIDALIAIRAAVPDVKIVVVSGTEDEVLVQRALAYGAFEFLRKPVELSRLRDSVESAFRMRALEA